MLYGILELGKDIKGKPETIQIKSVFQLVVSCKC